jgi:hypothetical protein
MRWVAISRRCLHRDAAIITDREMTESRDRQTLTIKQLHKAAGLSISTLRRRAKDGTIPVIQLGGRGKKLLFPMTILDELCIRQGAQSNASTRSARVASDSTEQDTPIPTTDHSHTEHTDERIQSAISIGGLTRPDSGPVPNWMRSPLLGKVNSNTGNLRNEICQNNAKTN